MSLQAEIESRVKAARKEIDDYLGSVRGVHALGAVVCFDPTTKQQKLHSHYCIPRTMSPKGGGVALTPDCVIQPSETYGIVVEMKKHFPKDNDEYLEHVRKYDQELRGWWSREELETHDLVLMTHIMSSANAVEAHGNLEKAKKGFARPFAVVEYSYTESIPALWFMLRKMSGRLSDQSLDDALRVGVPLHESIVVELFEECKFYDARPPLEHMLIVLYMGTLNLFVPTEEFEASGSVRKSVLVTIDELRDRMQEQFGPRGDGERQPKLPKKEWVKEAVEALVECELAKNESDGRVRILLRRLPKKDPLVWFVAKLTQAKAKRVAATQSGASEQGDLFAPPGE